MFATFAIALSLAQAVVVDRADPSDAVMNAEIVQRPSGMATSAFIEQLIDEAGARAWERRDERVPNGSTQLRLVALNRGGADGIILFVPAAEDSTGNACRIRRQRPGDAAPQRDRLLRYCIEAVSGAVNAGA